MRKITRTNDFGRELQKSKVANIDWVNLENKKFVFFFISIEKNQDGSIPAESNLA